MAGTQKVMADDADDEEGDDGDEEEGIGEKVLVMMLVIRW